MLRVRGLGPEPVRKREKQSEVRRKRQDVRNGGEQFWSNDEAQSDRRWQCVSRLAMARRKAVG